MDVGDGDFDDILGDFDYEDDNKNGDKRGKSHKSIKKWGKKGRKLRNKDPYGCHSDPDSVLSTSSTNSGGVIVNAGKYGSGGYTRANYAGAKAATPFEGGADRPKKPQALVAQNNNSLRLTRPEDQKIPEQNCQGCPCIPQTCPKPPPHRFLRYQKVRR